MLLFLFFSSHNVWLSGLVAIAARVLWGVECKTLTLSSSELVILHISYSVKWLNFWDGKKMEYTF